MNPEDSVAPETESADPDDAPSQPAEPNELEKVKDQLLRTAADFDNFRKRARRDLDDAVRRAREDTLREILPIIDDLERASNAAESAPDVESIAQGVSLVLKSFQDLAQRLSLVRVDTVGARFDPNVHDAIQQLATDEHDPGTIVAEITPGYRLADKLLRPAMVVVARKPDPAE